MQALIIYTTFTVSEDVVVHVGEILSVAGSNGDKVEVKQLDESDIRQLLVGTNQPSTKMFEKGPTVSSIDELQSAIVFMTENFGDPKDSEAAFRARFNAYWYRRNTNTPDKFDERLRSCVCILAKHFTKRKLGREVANILSETAFKWAPEYCASLLRFENMQQHERYT